MAEDINKELEEKSEIKNENEKSDDKKKSSGTKKASVYSKNSENTLINANIIRIILSTIVFTAVAVLLRFFPLQLPGIPSMFAVDFSVFPELLASIAYGPVIGVVVCLLKSLIHLVVDYRNVTAVPDISNFIVNASFVATAGLFYINSVAKAGKENGKEISYAKRGRLVFVSSMFAMIPSLIVQFFITNYYLFPSIAKQELYSQKFVLNEYITTLTIIRNHLPDVLKGLVPEISEIWQGIILVNFPITFIKTFIIASIIALLYPVLSPYLHFRKDNN